MRKFSFLRVLPLLPLVGWCLFFWSFIGCLHLGLIAQDPGAREVLELAGASPEQISFVEKSVCLKFTNKGYTCQLTEAQWRWGSSDTLATKTLLNNLRILRGE
jgi:hypothetical protein